MTVESSSSFHTLVIVVCRNSSYVQSICLFDKWRFPHSNLGTAYAYNSNVNVTPCTWLRDDYQHIYAGDCRSFTCTVVIDSTSIHQSYLRYDIKWPCSYAMIAMYNSNMHDYETGTGCTNLTEWLIRQACLLSMHTLKCTILIYFSHLLFSRMLYLARKYLM